jgi:hypothetical protein
MLLAKRLQVGLLIAVLSFLLSASQSLAQDQCYSDFSTITEAVVYDQDWFPEWDDGNSIEMAPTTCEPITLSDGAGPFTWRVEGTGFWFDEQHSITEQVIDSGSIDACADKTACGTAIITVTDAWGIMLACPAYPCNNCGSNFYTKREWVCP